MGQYQGSYSRSGDPEAMFDEELRYLETLRQYGKAVIDADHNDGALSRIHQRRRIIELTIGNRSPNDGFEIAQATSTTNNFKVTGGDGTDDGAGRIFVDGWPCVLKSDVDYTGSFDSRMRRIMPRVDAVTALTLTDRSANWTTNEHAGKTLTPDIENPGTTFTIASNTATEITISSGDLTVATDATKYYRIELTTPSGSDRTDEVYLDVFLDEVDDTEDTNLVHTDLTPNQSAEFRWALRQFVRVKEGGTTPAGHTDLDGRKHYTLKIATLNRLNGNAAILTAMIVDERIPIVPGGSSLTVQELDGTPTVINVQTIKVPNGALTDLGGNAVLIEAGGGGGGTGEISLSAAFSQDISGVPAPSAGTLGSTAFDTLDHDATQTEGQRILFDIPDDYDSGDLYLKITYAMTTGESQDIVVSTACEIIDSSAGTIDTSSYPETNQQITPPATADAPIRETFLTLTEGSFEVGDKLQFFVKRKPLEAGDTHSGDWQVVSYEISYTGQISTRNFVQVVQLFQDTDESAPASGTFGNFDTIDFQNGVDEEQKFEFTVPDNWDGSSDFHIRLVYAMSSAQSATVIWSTEGDIADVSAGTTSSFGVQDYTLATPNDTDAHRTVVIRALPASSLGHGDRVVVKLKRKGTSDTHTGLAKLLNAAVVSGIAPKSGFDQVVVEQHYLYAHDFKVQAGSPTAEQDSADLSGSGDFETWFKVTGNGASEQVDVRFQGRLMTTQSRINGIKVPVKASSSAAKYRLKVYTDGASHDTPAYADGADQDGTTTRDERILTYADLSKQPSKATGYFGRFFVVVEAYVDSSEVIYVGYPFVDLE